MKRATPGGRSNVVFFLKGNDVGRVLGCVVVDDDLTILQGLVPATQKSVHLALVVSSKDETIA